MATVHAPRHSTAGTPPADPAHHPVPPIGSATTLLHFSAIMAAALAVASLPGSSLFAIADIVVTGTRATSAAEIIARTGLRPGDRIAAVSISRVAQQVSSLPGIARAGVRITPGGRVIIRVQERDPYAAVPYRGGYLILDRSGVVIEWRRESGTLPTVTEEGFAPAWVHFGDRLPRSQIDQALLALGELPPQVVAPGTEVTADERGELTLLTPDQIAVRLGPLAGVRQRTALLVPLLEAVRGRSLVVEYLDLRYSGTVVMKPAGAQAPAGKRP